MNSLRILLFCLLALTCPAPVVINSYRFAASTYDPATDVTVIEWLKADALGLANDDPVATWTASVGNNATQATETNKPLFKTPVLNGLPIVRFDGVDNYMLMADLASQAQPFTVIVVFGLNSGATAQYAFGPNTTAAGRDIRLGATVGGQFTAYAGNGVDVVDFGASDTNYHIMQLVFNGASSSYRIDGGTRTTFSTSPGADPFLGIMLGAYPTPGFYANCDIAEIIVRSTGDTSQEAAIFSYLNLKWAIY